MTEILCYEDSYLQEFDAEVTAVVGKGVVLDRTAFYPGGGGQPPDTGTLTFDDQEVTVKRIRRTDGEDVHELDGEFPPVGTKVHGALDWERRYQLMRTHTALHILCGVVWRDYGAQVTGGNMEPLKARMDFEFENMTAEFAHEVEGLINKEVEAAREAASPEPADRVEAIERIVRTAADEYDEGVQDGKVVELEDDCIFCILVLRRSYYAPTIDSEGFSCVSVSVWGFELNIEF